MSNPDLNPTHRRGFLARLAAGAAALAGGGAVLSRAEAQGTPGPRWERRPVDVANEARAPWDDSWVSRLKGKHKQVFDAPEIANGTVLHQARTYMKGYEVVYGATDADMSAVLVIRHAAVPMVLGDELWERHDFGREHKLKDPATGQRTRRNPFINVKPGDRYSMVWPDGALDTLLARGVTVLACNLALMGVAGMIAQKEKLDNEAARSRLLANLVPGVIIMPSGIFAVARAQEAGCNYIRATA
ncbi:MAG TPA: hypothetical protein VJ596_00530 [Gemmatimonadaceae bacterium]|nr:hypothetical protein [Gemmatimonadaceae bacterium]